jgi:hypothetical protein
MTAFRPPSEVISEGLWAGCCRWGHVELVVLAR